MTRTDIHRPSEILPEDYQWVAIECIPIFGLGDALFIQRERERIRAHMAATGGTYSSHEHGGNCGVCGNANAIYTHLFYHAKTNSYVRFGDTCAQKVEVSVNERAFNEFRKNVQDARKNVAGKAKAAATLADLSLERAWDIYCAWADASDNYEVRNALTSQFEENTVIDIVSKLVKYGSLSEKQTTFLGNLLKKIDDRSAKKARWAAESAAAAPAPTGRIEVSGEVISAKWQPGYARYSEDTLKMLVKTDAGWKLWATVPRAAVDELANGNNDVAKVIRGGRITIKATVEPSQDDPKFAFGKRPTLVSFTPAPVAVAAE